MTGARISCGRWIPNKRLFLEELQDLNDIRGQREGTNRTKRRMGRGNNVMFEESHVLTNNLCLEVAALRMPPMSLSHFHNWLSRAIVVVQ